MRKLEKSELKRVYGGAGKAFGKGKGGGNLPDAWCTNHNHSGETLGTRHTGPGAFCNDAEPHEEA